MAVGNIKHINSPIVEIIYIAKGAGTITAGDIVAFDSNGLVIPATTSTLAPHGILTDLTHVVGATTYFGVCLRGYIVAVCGTATKPNKLVKSDSSLDFIPVTQTISATYVQSEMQEFYKVVGRYIRLETDNQFAPTDASASQLGIISVGAGWN